MRLKLLCSTARLVICSSAFFALTACAPDAPTGAFPASADVAFARASGKVDVCHQDDGIIEVGAPALAAHLAHGDYVTTLLVNGDGASVGDGVHFDRITDALATARAGRLARGETESAACRITILVPAGVFQGVVTTVATGATEQFPLIVDVPDVTLRGALAMGLDEAGRATGASTTGMETTLSAAEPLPILNGASTPIIVANAHPGGSAGNGLTVEGFVFQSGHDPAIGGGGQAILSVRAAGLTIRGNRIEGGFTEGVDIRSGAANVLENFFGEGAAVTCQVCLAGPGRFQASGNRILAGGQEGIVAGSIAVLPMPNGVEPLTLPAVAEAWADVRNNEVRDHLKPSVGGALRVDAVGLKAPNVHGVIHAVYQDNLLVNNRFGIIVHAGFPAPGTDLAGNADVTLGGNKILQTCEASLLVALARHTTALGLGSGPYLLNSTIQISLGGDVPWSQAWYAHPAGFGNTLIVDGEVIPNGARQFYDALGCPGD